MTWILVRGKRRTNPKLGRIGEYGVVGGVETHIVVLEDIAQNVERNRVVREDGDHPEHRLEGGSNHGC